MGVYRAMLAAGECPTSLRVVNWAPGMDFTADWLLKCCFSLGLGLLVRIEGRGRGIAPETGLDKTVSQHQFNCVSQHARSLPCCLLRHVLTALG